MTLKDILVIGESCRDVFIYCESERLCPDVPVPVLNVLSQIENGGMAKNVERNILQYKNCNILTNKNWHDITKTRYVHQKTNHMFFRVDSFYTIPKINLSEIDLNYKLIVISDYNKGFLSENDISYICNSHKNVFLDTKKVLGDWASGAKFIKINNFEYKKSEKFITENLSNKIIHTIGGDGCIFQKKIYPVNTVDVKDTSGAGDSFMAALVVKYIDTENIKESIEFANKCACEVVKHRGVTTI